MNLYDQLSQELPAPNDTWTKHDILLYKLILTVAASVTDLNKEATQLLVKTAVDGVTAKLIVAPSTEAKQDALKTAIDLITAKLIASPATEAKQDTGNTSLASILALSYLSRGNEFNVHLAGLNTTVTTDIKAAAGAGIYNMITAITVTNGHATIGTWVNITNENDVILWRGYAAALGGGFAISFPTPLVPLLANKKLQVACITTGADISVSINGFTSTH